jgi:hypothetical protein
VSVRRAVAAAMTLLTVTGAGCSSSVPRPGAHRTPSSVAPAQVSACRPAPAAQLTESTVWPSRTVLRESVVESISAQLVDPAAGAVFLLVPKTNTPVRGPWVLCRISLATGAVWLGPTLPAGGLTMAAGYLWVYSASGPGSPPVVTEINPLTMQSVRPIPVPSMPDGFGGVQVTPGPAARYGSVSIGR